MSSFAHRELWKIGPSPRKDNVGYIDERLRQQEYTKRRAEMGRGRQSSGRQPKWASQIEEVKDFLRDRGEVRPYELANLIGYRSINMLGDMTDRILLYETDEGKIGLLE